MLSYFDHSSYLFSELNRSYLLIIESLLKGKVYNFDQSHES